MFSRIHEIALDHMRYDNFDHEKENELLSYLDSIKANVLTMPTLIDKVTALEEAIDNYTRLHHKFHGLPQDNKGIRTMEYHITMACIDLLMKAHEVNIPMSKMFVDQQLLSPLWTNFSRYLTGALFFNMLNFQEKMYVAECHDLTQEPTAYLRDDFANSKIVNWLCQNCPDERGLEVLDRFESAEDRVKRDEGLYGDEGTPHIQRLIEEMTAPVKICELVVRGNSSNALLCAYMLVDTYIRVYKQHSKIDEVDYSTTLDEIFIRKEELDLVEDSYDNIGKRVGSFTLKFDPTTMDQALRYPEIAKAVEDDLIVLDDGTAYFYKNREAIFLSGDSGMCDKEEMYEHEYFSFREFYEWLKEDGNSVEARMKLLWLYEQLRVDMQWWILSMEDEDEMYPHILDEDLKDFFRSTRYFTEELLLSAKKCREDHSQKVGRKEWACLLNKDIEVLRKCLDTNEKEPITPSEKHTYYNSTQYYKILKKNDAVRYLEELYLRDDLFLFDLKSTCFKEDFFKVIRRLTEQERYSFLLWIHRFNIIKAKLDESGTMLERYHAYINRSNDERESEIFRGLVCIPAYDKDSEQILNINSILGGEDVPQKGGNVPNTHAKQQVRRKNHGFDIYIVDKSRQADTLKFLHLHLEGKIGKMLALYVECAIDAELITRPSFGDLQAEFGVGGTKTAFNKYFQKDFFKDEEKEPVIKMMRDLG